MTAQTILPANSAASGGYDVANSARFDVASSTRMEATNSSAGSRQIFTFSTWLKRSNPDSTNNFQVLYSAVDSGGNERIMFEEDKLIWDFDIAGVDYSVETSGRLYRDFSAWYHIVVTKDTTQSTEANRIKMYVNGVQQTLAEIQLGFPDQNSNQSINMAIEHQLFAQADGEEFGGYACETVLIDGTAYAADSFGEFDSDSGIWKPIDVSGLTFGTNGFYMNYANSSALGNDVSGNNNDYTTANLAATDQSTDTCTNNFCTLSPLWNSFNQGTLSEGNLKSTMTSEAYKTHLASFGVSQGKWYWEIKVTQASNVNYLNFGVTDESTNKNIDFKALAGTTLYNNTTGKISIDGSEDGSAAAKFAVGDIVGIALNMDDKEISFFKNGSALFSDVDMSSTSNLVFPFHIAYTYATYIFEYNFGGTQSFAISSGNADGNGYGNFEYAVPSGYFALCTKILAEYGG